MKCISINGKQFEHVFVFEGAGPEKHCIYCGIQLDLSNVGGPTHASRVREITDK